MANLMRLSANQVAEVERIEKEAIERYIVHNSAAFRLSK